MTPKQEEFCRQYLIDLNATQAAIRAGYAERSANVTGARLLTKANIAASIASLMTKRSIRVERDSDEVVRRLWQIVEADVTIAFHEDGRPKNPSEIPKALRAALASIKMGDVYEVKANDRIRALELLGKHYGLYVDRVETKITEGQITIYLPDNGRDKEATDGKTL